VIPADEKTVGDLLQSVKEGSAAPLEPQTSGSEFPCSGIAYGGRNCGDSKTQVSESRPFDKLRAGPGAPGFPPKRANALAGAPGSVAGSAAQAVPPIVIGKDLAETLGVKVGDGVLVTSPQGALTPFGLVPRYQRFQVVGIFKSGFYQYDSSYAFVRLTDAQKLFSEPDLISVISFKVDDLYHADRVGREIEAAAGKGFQTTNWMEQNRELFRALKLEQIVTFIVLALIVCVAALNILIALTMMVMEKTRDIAVLMSFGVTGSQVRRIFLLQGFLISVIGTVLGLILGYGLSWVGGHYPFPLNAEVYSIDHLPFAPRVWHGMIVAVVSLGVSLIATLYPSGSAAKVLPAEALRYE
jgi:lipoprotein-releasing system permease protein